MLKKIIPFASLLLIAAIIYSFTPFSADSQKSTEIEADVVKWYTWDEAVKANEKAPKKFMIDLYTHWCGWCKRMDKTTFSDPKVAKYLNENFYPIKFNAEQKEEITFQGQTFKWVDGGRNGIHTLAYSLLECSLPV